MSFRIISCNTVVVGAGAAGLNAADELKARGVDVLLVADDMKGGVSLNSGSDKQTYYKLSMAGDAPDSIGAMAASLFSGGGMHGDHALIMAANSPRCFYKLLSLGVPFPHNRWGEFVGYQTDHDFTCRATSAGPYTSRYMAEALLRSVRARGVRCEDGLSLLSILRGTDGAACGLIMCDTKQPSRPLVMINARNILLCSGGQRTIYSNTVYPSSQRGATGAAIRAGASANNLCYWQYGLASVKVKWNVSGSYQQAVPAYTDGVNEFLAPHFSSARDALDSVFLKGYQWPFDSKKIRGSSKVDMAVRALTGSGARAYLDFTRDPECGVFENLGGEALSYLSKCGADGRTPYGRLSAINRQSIDFYMDNGIDLSSEPLEIAVCAQHSNGGLKVDEWWRTSVPRLYAAGEASGAFGVYRPGGSALNETQVGSLRAATHIASSGGSEAPIAESDFMSLAGAAIEGELNLLTRPVGVPAESEVIAHLPAEMDDCAGIVRSVDKMRALHAKIARLINGAPSLGDPVATADAINTMALQSATLSSMIAQAGFSGDAGHIVEPDPRSIGDAPDASLFAFETDGDTTRALPVRPLPESGGWFEEVWKEYISANQDR